MIFAAPILLQAKYLEVGGMITKFEITAQVIHRHSLFKTIKIGNFYYPQK